MRTTKEDVELQKKQILEAAFTFFAQRGYAATNLTDIAKSIGISRVPIYYHFKDKPTLFTSVYAHWCDTLYEEYSQIYTSNDNIFDMIRRGLEYSIQAVANKAFRLGHDIALFREELPEASKENERILERMLDLTMAGVRRAISNGELKKDTDARAMINVYFMVYRGIEGALNGSLIGPWGETEVKRIIDEYIIMLRATYAAEA